MNIIVPFSIRKKELGGSVPAEAKKIFDKLKEKPILGIKIAAKGLPERRRCTKCMQLRTRERAGYFSFVIMLHLFRRQNKVLVENCHLQCQSAGFSFCTDPRAMRLVIT
jgi:hypothetical protein